LKKTISCVNGKRSDSGKWAIIGEAIGGEESFIDGLYREVNEETGHYLRNSIFVVE
jgi:ADP-ribose pyrophosphatase YjhB (NUDIX family)